MGYSQMIGIADSVGLGNGKEDRSFLTHYGAARKFSVEVRSAPTTGASE